MSLKINKVFVFIEKKEANYLEIEKTKRYSPLIDSIRYYFPDVEVSIVYSVDNVPKTNSLLFAVRWSSLDASFLEDLKEDGHKIVVLDVSDNPMDYKGSLVWVDVAGRRLKNLSTYTLKKTEHIPKTNGIAGYGFLRNFSFQLPNVKWTDRKPHVFFRGYVATKNRINFLKSARLNFEQRSNITVAIHSPSFQDFDFSFRHIHGCFDHLCDRSVFNISLDQYTHDMSLYKFNLAPMGFGHTYRFVESMAVQSLVLTECLSDIEFAVDVFKAGETHLELGHDLSNWDQVIEVCKNDSLAEKIAKEGNRVWRENFALNKQGAMPIKTFTSLIDKICDRLDVVFK